MNSDSVKFTKKSKDVRMGSDSVKGIERIYEFCFCRIYIKEY